MTKQQKNITTTLIIISFLAIVFLIAGWIWKLPENVSEQENSLLVKKYEASVGRLDEIITFYQMQDQSLSQLQNLKSFINLPFTAGQVGKMNPFELPLPPEEEFLNLQQGN